MLSTILWVGRLFFERIVVMEYILINFKNKTVTTDLSATPDEIDEELFKFAKEVDKYKLRTAITVKNGNVDIGNESLVSSVS